MADKKPRDWARTGTVAGMAEWLRKESGALAVVVIRVNDAVLAADLAVAPRDVYELVADRMPALVAELDAARKEKRPARAVLEPVRE